MISALTDFIKIVIFWAIVIAIVTYLFGCPDRNQDQEQLENRLADIETIVNEQSRGRESNLEQQLAASNAVKQQIDAQLQIERAKNMQMQIDSANSRQNNRGGIVPMIVWQICLSVILVAMTAVTVKALFVFFSGQGRQKPTVVYITAGDGVKIMEDIKLLEDAKVLTQIRSNRGGAA